MIAIRRLLVTVGLGVLAACGGSDDEQGPANDTNNTNNTNNAAATFDRVFNEVIQPSCSCHLTAQGAGGLSMADATTAYSMLADQPATSGGPCDGETRVVPGDASASVLYRKVSGTDLCGQRMPLNGGSLGEAQQELIRAWIADGAPAP